MTETVFFVIGNSDDKLTQIEWYDFCQDSLWLSKMVSIKIYGEWYSTSNSPYQNACFSFNIKKEDIQKLRDKLANLAKKFNQTSIALFIGDSELVMGI